jgi:DUF4097 and DUF4098 domain-containing protein YvlB
MRYSAVLLFILLPVLAYGGTVTETRSLALPSEGIDTLVIKCGAGSLKLSGVSAAGEIQVTAQNEGENFSEADFKVYIQKNLILSLHKQANRAILKSDLKQPPKKDQDARINLSIELPDNINVDIVDGSGAIRASALKADVRIDDDTGSIKIRDVTGEVRIGDSSGSIAVEEVTGNVFIADGSGSIGIESVRGNLNIKDGSGKIKIVDIEGNVTVSDGSGSIEIQDVSENVLIIIREEGSGLVEVEGAKGRVTIRP